MFVFFFFFLFALLTNLKDSIFLVFCFCFDVIMVVFYIYTPSKGLVVGCLSGCLSVRVVWVVVLRGWVVRLLVAAASAAKATAGL